MYNEQPPTLCQGYRLTMQISENIGRIYDAFMYVSYICTEYTGPATAPNPIPIGFILDYTDLAGILQT